MRDGFKGMMRIFRLGDGQLGGLVEVGALPPLLAPL